MKLTKEQKSELEKKKKEEDALEQKKRDYFVKVIRTSIDDRLTDLRDDDSRRDFLTDIFCLTEDIRHDLSIREANMETASKEQKKNLRSSSIEVPCGTSRGQEISNGASGEIHQGEAT